ncbi:MAG: quinone oxidoreductase [Alphaproteobacteria bacterium]|nr:quinone oxidoreductase [Alphaproteobacteria bacterium]
MKAVRIEQLGGPEVLQYVDIDLADPAPGQVRLRHTAIGVNFIDTYHRTGIYPVPLPTTLGGEAVGVIEALGAGVSGFRVGERVGYCTQPLVGYAEAANVLAERLIKLPPTLSDDVAVASMLKGMTVQFLLTRCFAVQKGQTILWHAAAGGVGSIASQWARHLGVEVIGTVGSDDKRNLAHEYGCAHVLNTRTDDWVAKVREITHGTGVPVVYDSIGKDTWEGSLNCLAVRGMMVSFGNASGPVPPFAPAILSQKGSLYVTRPTLFNYVSTQQELQSTADDVFSRILDGTIKVHIHAQFPLKDARAAHVALHSRATTGAIVLRP